MIVKIKNLDLSLKSIYNRNSFRRHLINKCKLINQVNKKPCTVCNKIFKQAYFYRNKFYCRICTKYEEVPI